MVRNTLVQLLPPFVRAALGLVLVAVLSRYLGVTGFGQYALVLAYVLIFWGVFSDWGVGTIVLREISRSGANRVELIGGAASLQALIAIATYLLMLISLVVMRYPPVVKSSIVIYGVFLLMSPLDILALPFQADLRVGRLVAPAVIGSVVAFGLTILVVRLGGSLPALVGAALAGVVVQYAWVTVIALRNLKGIRPSRSKWMYYMVEGWPLGLATIAGTVFQQGPVFALSFLSLESVGLYNAASRIPQQLNLLPLIVRVSSFPLLSEAWVSDRVRFRRLLNNFLGASLLISVPLALLGIGLAEPLLRVLFGPAFAGAALPFKVLLAAFAITFPSILLGEAMIAAGFQRVNLLINLAGVPVLIAVLLAMVPRGGAVGAAIAVLSINAFMGAAVLVAGPRLFKGPISLAPLFFGVAAAAVGVAVLILARGLGSLPAAMLAAASAAIVLGTADRSTFKLLWGMAPFRRSTAIPPL